MDRFVKITAGSGVAIRPWLQAFHWRTKTYSPEYILTQVRTATQHGGVGFLFWNAANDYSKPFAAMPVIMTNPNVYLHTQGVTVARNTSAGAGAQTEKAARSAAGQQH